MARLVDYRNHLRRYGHDYTFSSVDGGYRGDMIGWGPKDGSKIKENDVLVLSNSASFSGVSPYKVKQVTYWNDPSDMWSAKVVFQRNLDVSGLGV